MPAPLTYSTPANAPHPGSLQPSEVNLKEYMQVLRKRRTLFLQVFAVVFAACLVVTFLAKPVYQASARLLVQSGSASVNLVDASNPIATMLQAAQPDTIATQLQVMQSGPFMEKAREAAGSKPKPGVLPASARAEAAEGTNVIRITGEGGDPTEVAGLVNAMVKVHLDQTDGAQGKQLRSLITFVKEEKEKAARSLLQAENALVQFRKEHRVVQLQADQEARTRDYVDQKSRVSEMESNVASTRAQLRELQARLDKEPLENVTESTRENSRVAKLQEKLDDLKLHRADLVREFKPTSRQVQSLDAQIGALQAQFDAEPKELKVRNSFPNERRIPLQSRIAELEALTQGYQAQRNEAQAKFNSHKGLVDNLGPWEVRQARLEQEQKNAQEAYTQLTTRLRDLEIRANANIPMARLIEPASVPSVPIRPSKSTNVVFSLVLALCVAAGMAFLQEYLDDRISSPEDMERLSALPALGQVPMLQQGQPRLVSAMPGNAEAVESFRTLRSSIGFAGFEAPLRRLLVTSALPGEGKTITSANLATAMAMDGKRVILIDGDLRRPTLNRVMELPQNPGLSELLVGMKTLEQVLQPTEIEGLQVICAGSIPPNPAELLGSRAFDQLLAQIEDRCDVVILDSPPCLPVADPLLLATRVDGVILVAHMGQTKKADLRRAEDVLQRAHARIVGVVFNRVQHRGGRSQYYGNYYFYGQNGHASPDLNGRNGHYPSPNGAKPERLHAGIGAAEEGEKQG